MVKTTVLEEDESTLLTQFESQPKQPCDAIELVVPIIAER